MTALVTVDLVMCALPLMAIFFVVYLWWSSARSSGKTMASVARRFAYSQTQQKGATWVYGVWCLIGIVGTINGFHAGMKFHPWGFMAYTWFAIGFYTFYIDTLRQAKQGKQFS